MQKWIEEEENISDSNESGTVAAEEDGEGDAEDTTDVERHGENAVSADGEKKTTETDESQEENSSISADSEGQQDPMESENQNDQ